MGLQGSFGVPDPSTQAVATVANKRQFPIMYLLSVTVAGGGFERIEDIGLALKESEIDAYFSEWIADPANRARYAGRKRIKQVPFVGRL